MSKWGSMAITSAILLIASLLIGVVAFSVLSGSTDGTTGSEQDIIELYNQLVDDSIDEISTYIQIQDRIGKYYGEPQHQRLQKIALMIKPLVSINIDISELTIKLCNGKDVMILRCNNKTDMIGAQSLFEHTLWSNLEENNFSFIVTHDKDKSIIDFKTINSNTDMGYIIIKLPEEFYMKKGDTLAISLFPETGITRNIVIEAPLPIKSVVYLD